MGVLNVTPDSFSDGGRYLDHDQAVARGLELVAEGAVRLEESRYTLVRSAQ